MEKWLYRSVLFTLTVETWTEISYSIMSCLRKCLLLRSSESPYVFCVTLVTNLSMLLLYLLWSPLLLILEIVSKPVFGLKVFGCSGSGFTKG